MAKVLRLLGIELLNQSTAVIYLFQKKISKKWSPWSATYCTKQTLNIFNFLFEYVNFVFVEEPIDEKFSGLIELKISVIGHITLHLTTREHYCNKF